MWFDGLRTYCTTAGISALHKNVKPFAYPNPVEAQLNITTDHEALIIVRNIMGQELNRILIIGNSVISTSDWPSGVYLLELISNSNQLIQRLIKK